ncbi:MAG TPA: hypothetical protein VKN35_15845 [Xanthomonadales bacterium]|nr:hypothetical protein [Xanthomonadales bacterium]
MILNRLANSIRKQDWFTVFLEFVIVVAGIFAGLQANEWAQERQDRKQELASLERLFFESQSAFELLDDYVQRTLRLNQMRRAAVQFSDSSSPVPENELPLKIGINTLPIFPAAVPVSIAFDELRSSGQMQLIRSVALREQIAEFHAGLAYFNQRQEGFLDFSSRFFDVYQPHVIWDYNPDATTTDILLSTYNWETLRADEGFMFVAIGLLRNQLVAEESLVQLRDQALSLCQTLGNVIGETCKQ